MSRQLPAQPDLDHLKKQAKALLGDLQSRNPAAKLADALHALSREYGFASWPKLKAHVQSLARPSVGRTGVGTSAATLQANPFVGNWKADLSRSKRHPANEFRAATLQFAVVGDTVTITNVGVDASGREERAQHTFIADGIEHPSEHGNEYALTARWLGPHVLETVATKDGQIVGRGIYAVSPDGKTLTVSAKDAAANAAGWQSDFEQVIVLDRC